MTISHYRIVSELGRGGMGIVYKAEDTRLDRTVAIKVLPAAALASQDDRARFYREAKAAAALNHPNIAQVYQIDEAVPSGSPQEDVRPYIAMEFIEGGTLEERIKAGPLKLDEAIRIATQVAEALKAAHAKDIVHRDVKSANIMLTAEGKAKVLDFGLAQTAHSTKLTRMGSTLGTVAYMSPEQARGENVDHRTDLYSLGTVLFEMIAGRLPFGGEYEQAVVYSILNEPPEPLTSVRTGVPMQLEWIVTKLLAKDADYRYQTAADLLADLKALDLSGSGMSRRSMPALSAPIAAATSGRSALPRWVLGAVLAAAVLGGVTAWFAKPKPNTPTIPLVSFPLELEESLERTGRRSIAISPDGRFLAYVTLDGIRLRRMDALGSSTMLVDVSTSPRTVRELFYSPDSRWLAFEDDQNDRLMRVDMSGGSPVRIADLPHSLDGAFWAADGDIYLGFGDDGIGRIPGGSGTVEMVIPPDSLNREFAKPSLLPDGRSMIYTLLSGRDYNEVRMLDLESGDDRRVLASAGWAHYMDSGHLLFVDNRTLFAISFDFRRGEWLDNRVPLVDEVKVGGSGNAQYDVSEQGVLVFATDRAGDMDEGRVLVWLSQDGTTEQIPGEPRNWATPDLSPDASQIVVEESRAGDTEFDLWLIDARTGTQTRLTSNGKSSNGVWSPEGDRVAHLDTDGYMLVRYLNDAFRVDTLLYSFGRPTSWSSDGRFLAYEASDRLRSDRDVAVLNLETGESIFFPEKQEGEADADISPDGKWIAYQKVDSTSLRVYVLPFPAGGDPKLISESAAFNPKWSVDGQRVYYQTPRSFGMSEFDPETGIAQQPRMMTFEASSFRFWDFAVHPDGRILEIMPESSTRPEIERAAGSELRFVVNFDELLRSRLGSER